MIAAVPPAQREAALALGVSRSATIVRVVLPAAMHGIATGVVLGLPRIAGEAAPLMFTALGNQFLSVDMFGAMDALPLRIFTYARGPYEYWHEQAWAMSLMLVGIIPTLSLGIRALLGTRVRIH